MNISFYDVKEKLKSQKALGIIKVELLGWDINVKIFNVETLTDHLCRQKIEMGHEGLQRKLGFFARN